MPVAAPRPRRPTSPARAARLREARATPAIRNTCGRFNKKAKRKLNVAKRAAKRGQAKRARALRKQARTSGAELSAATGGQAREDATEDDPQAARRPPALWRCSLSPARLRRWLRPCSASARLTAASVRSRPAPTPYELAVSNTGDDRDQRRRHRATSPFRPASKSSPPPTRVRRSSIGNPPLWACTIAGDAQSVTCTGPADHSSASAPVPIGRARGLRRHVGMTCQILVTVKADSDAPPARYP